uniref:UDP-N-acetylglucosamine--N-acetylmuramyl-(Pentapeptide) pyrophosphoryl-undecaprenol N-acetylglucosamine transferase n=1 Tax=Anthurium amnicola TaxID=1678845 RepID=A0A1D1XSW8_9ARAE
MKCTRHGGEGRKWGESSTKLSGNTCMAPMLARLQVKDGLNKREKKWYSQRDWRKGDTKKQMEWGQNLSGITYKERSETKTHQVTFGSREEGALLDVEGASSCYCPPGQFPNCAFTKFSSRGARRMNDVLLNPYIIEEKIIELFA